MMDAVNHVTLHQYEISPFCAKARRVLHLKGVPFTVHNVSVSGSRSALKALGPIGKLPVLEVDGRRIPDSTEIARFLDAEVPEPPLWPDAPRDRALCHDAATASRIEGQDRHAES